MPSLLKQLSALVQDAFEAAGLERRHGLVVPSARPDLCQFQCNGAMPAAKAMGMNPRQAAQSVVERLRALRDKVFQSVEAVGPGFINLTCGDAWLATQVRAAALDPKLGAPVSETGMVFLDFGGPNVAKPLHVGHLRSAIIGDCLQRLHRFIGAEVLSDIHLGDWGTQMGMLIEAVREEQPGLPYFVESAGGPFPTASPVSLADLERLYPAMSARCKVDPAAAEKARAATRALQAGRPGYRALWRHFVDVSIAAIKADFAGLGVSWDLWLGESDSQAAIPAMLEDLRVRGVSAMSEGATVIHLDPIANTETPPLLLVKSDGGYLYGTTDLAALRDRVATLKAKRLLYVADRRQSLHFAQVFQGAAKAGYLAGAGAEHVAFGTVNGKDGKPYKTRDGGVMPLRQLLADALEKAVERLKENGMVEDLLKAGPGNDAQAALDRIARQVALAALKFADLCNPRAGDYVFDLEKFMLFEGRTGPYLLYAAVRMKSILRKAAERGFEPGEMGEPAAAERPLVLKLLALPETLERAAAESAPNLLCDWAYELAGVFSTFYQSSNILREEDPGLRASWLALTKTTLKGLETVLGLLGLETPEQM
ncbi:MAG TPA: arginine--tRNA ligase [bacterium]|jgi:arginyl-tRNA synthetase|nr:arginine--tRNA ligase [bacterium]